MKNFLMGFITDAYKKGVMTFYVFFGLVLVLFSRITLRAGSDDTAHIETLKELTAFQWTLDRAISWQPRLFSDFMYALMNFNLTIWSIISAILLTILLFIIAHIASISSPSKAFSKVGFISCASFFMIYPYVISNGVLWYTGSFHYLLPVTVLFIGLIPFCYMLYGKPFNGWLKNSIAFIAAGCACYTEQTAAVLLCVSFSILFFCRIRDGKFPDKKSCFLWLFILANSLFFLVWNFTQAVRSYSEIRWYPDYHLLSLVDRLYQGVNVTNFHYINSSNILFLFLTLFLALAFRQKFRGKTSLFGFIPFVFVLMSIIPFDILLSGFGKNGAIATAETGTSFVYNIQAVFAEYLFNPLLSNPPILIDSYRVLSPSIACLTIMLFSAVLIYLCFKDKSDAFFVTLLYLAALASGYILGFSPTIYASGSRIFFIGNLLMVFICSKLYVEIINDSINCFDSRKYSNVFFSIFLLFAVIGYVRLFILTKQYVLWL